jgi:hypothetical protein
MVAIDSSSQAAGAVPDVAGASVVVVVDGARVVVVVAA